MNRHNKHQQQQQQQQPMDAASLIAQALKKKFAGAHPKESAPLDDSDVWEEKENVATPNKKEVCLHVVMNVPLHVSNRIIYGAVCACYVPWSRFSFNNKFKQS